MKNILHVPCYIITKWFLPIFRRYIAIIVPVFSSATKFLFLYIKILLVTIQGSELFPTFNKNEENNDFSFEIETLYEYSNNV